MKPPPRVPPRTTPRPASRASAHSSSRAPAPTAHRPWDAGLQPERTALAWRRTVLSQTLAAVALARLVAHTSVPLSLALLATGLPLGLLLGFLTCRRAGRVDSRLRAASPPRAGRLHLGLTALSCLLGCAALAYILLP